MTVVAVSGGFDPVHPGHLDLFQRARALGDYLVVIVNGDEFLRRKKGYAFMPLEDRRRVLRELRCVDEVVAVDDDQTVCATLRMLCSVPSLRPTVFANGGDRASVDSPERQTCEELGIRMVDGLGEKVRSSSELVARVKEQQRCQGTTTG